MSEKVKVAPQSKESEMMVLGCMLTSINSLNIAADGLDDSDFYFTEHKIVFRILKGAYLADRPADVHLVCEELKRQEKLKTVGGAAYITTLAQYAGTSAYIEEYVELVRSKSILRRMINAAQEVEGSALAEPDDVHTALDNAQQAFFKISQTFNPVAGYLIGDVLTGVKATSQKPFLKELEERQERYQTRGPEDSGITGLATHFTDLDRMINGLGNSNMIIVGGRPGMGKTALCLNIAERVCFRNGTPVGIFSLEMTAEQLVHRLIASQSEVPSEKIKTGSLNGLEYQRVVKSVHEMQKHTMVIDDQPGLRITDLRARARRMKEAHGIGLLIIDYLQLLSGSSTSRNLESRQNEISEISRMLKNLARELDIPIICGSQLSRRVEERQGHRPMMSDLRESGCLTGDTQIQDASTGKLYTIKELAERPQQTPILVHGVDKDLKLGPHRMIKAFYSGKKQVFELKTRSGRTIKASGNHPFLKLEGWTPLDQLKPTDRIGIPRKLELNQPLSAMQNEELALLGHLLGDGCILPRQPYHYTSADEDNIQTVAETSKLLFGIQARTVKQKKWHHVYLPSPISLTHGVFHPITNWFSQLRIERVRSYEKKIPKSVFECDPSKIAFFLHHLWATDGNISVSKQTRKSDLTSIYYASSSPTLCQQTQQLLLRVGVQSTLSKVPSNRGYRPMYHLSVFGASQQKTFLTTVGCAGTRGKIIPQLLEKIDCIQPNPNNDVIPKEAWATTIKQAKDSLGLGCRDVCKGLNTSYCGSSLFKAGISRQPMSLLHNILPSPEIYALANSDIYWDEITSITPLGIEDVYDATVENVHNFVANDIIVHNSLEQDSDVVIFLLRREYYDPNDKPGMCEVHVSKNRHGSVGSLQLTYRKEIVRFDNYSPLSSSSEEVDAAFAEFN
ncbi:MAG: replicative DNA helicase [Verrucomicrobia bacterium]|nr:replicative DNA helicase [Verrucomicrobiota bacterium]